MAFQILLQVRPWKWHKASKEAVSFKKYIILDSRQFTQKIPLTTSADGILLLNNETLAEIEGHRKRLERQEKKLEEAAKRENVKNRNV